MIDSWIEFCTHELEAGLSPFGALFPQAVCRGTSLHLGPPGIAGELAAVDQEVF